MGEIIIKCLILILVALPFVALVSDVMGRTDGLLFRVQIGVIGVMVVSTVLFGGLQERPHVANVVVGAFFAWPFALLIAKAVKPSMTWYSMWISVLIMSWFLVNLIVGLSDGGGLGGAINFLLGWMYMAIPFAILSAIFLGAQILIKKIRKN